MDGLWPNVPARRVLSQYFGTNLVIAQEKYDPTRSFLRIFNEICPDEAP